MADTGAEEAGALLNEAALKGQTEIADILIAKGASVSVRDRSGATPLHQAALKGNLRIAALLLEHGAAVDARDGDGATPLHAAALAGQVEKIELPKPGQWIRQGQRILSFYRAGEKTEMVSPTEGEVMEINTELLANPALLRSDPYEKGWLATVHVPDEENTSRNLVPKGLVREWMREAVERLYAHQPALAGAAMADGGRPADDLLAGLPEKSWKEVTGEFFLTV